MSKFILGQGYHFSKLLTKKIGSPFPLPFLGYVEGCDVSAVKGRRDSPCEISIPNLADTSDPNASVLEKLVSDRHVEADGRFEKAVL